MNAMTSSPLFQVLAYEIHTFFSFYIYVRFILLLLLLQGLYQSHYECIYYRM